GSGTRPAPRCAGPPDGSPDPRPPRPSRPWAASATSSARAAWREVRRRSLTVRGGPRRRAPHTRNVVSSADRHVRLLLEPPRLPRLPARLARGDPAADLAARRVVIAGRSPRGGRVPGAAPLR